MFWAAAAGALAASARRGLERVTAPGADEAGNAFGIVIDAGSTGSRLHIFTWNASTAGERLPANLSTPVELAADTFATTPGISSPGGLDALDTVLEHARTDLAPFKAKWGDIPIFLKATAGMRILTDARRQGVMTQVRAKLRATGFQYRSDAQARVISGEEEGVFGWLTVNYRLGKLKQGEIFELEDTVGALDLGGASTQVTFKPMASPDILANLFPVRLGMQVAEDVYTHSFLHFGENEAIRRANRLVLLAAQGPGSVPNPCYPEGFRFEYEDLSTGRSVAMVGSSNYSACHDTMDQLMDKGATCLTDPNPVPPAGSGVLLPPIDPGSPLTCSVGGVYQPPLNVTRFVAFSAFSYVWSFLGLPLQGSTPDMLRSAAAAFCATSWEQAQKAHPGVPAKFLSSYCATASLAHSLLTTGYGLAGASTAVTVADPSEDYDWALGSILWDANEAFRLR